MQDFHIGVAPNQEHRAAKRNMQSAEQNPQVIRDYIDSEVTFLAHSLQARPRVSALERSLKSASLESGDLKLSRLHLMLADWETKKSCTRKELESLIGTLQHATKVICPGRRRAIALLSMEGITTTIFASMQNIRQTLHGGQLLQLTGMGHLLLCTQAAGPLQ